MSIFVFRILGENFLATIDEKKAKYGFFTYRVVEAEDPNAAEKDAMKLLREDEKLRGITENTPDDPPTMRVDETYEIDKREDFDDAAGFIWFEMKPKRWWQFWR